MNKLTTKIVSTVVVILVAVVVALFSRGDAPETKSPRTDVEIEYTFRTEKQYHAHFEKHGAEFGDITREEYLALANQLIASTTALRKTEKEDGDQVIYEEADNMFLILSTDGYIRTFFRPSGGLEYYERQ